MTVDEFRCAMDDDAGFKSKRRALVFTSLLLLALIVSGAVIKEANTFIFKIEFTNHEGLRYLLVLAVLSCMLRYYAYSERYHTLLIKFWSDRLLSDRSVYCYDREDDLVIGLLGRRMDVFGGDEPGIEYPEYKKTGFLKRCIGYPSKGVDDYHGEYICTEYVNLNKYNENWRRRDFCKLLFAEMKYRIEAWIKYRETLDLVSPYVLGFTSLIVFVVSYFRG